MNDRKSMTLNQRWSDLIGKLISIQNRPVRPGHRSIMPNQLMMTQRLALVTRKWRLEIPCLRSIKLRQELPRTRN